MRHERQHRLLETRTGYRALTSFAPRLSYSPRSVSPNFFRAYVRMRCVPHGIYSGSSKSNRESRSVEYLPKGMWVKISSSSRRASRCSGVASICKNSCRKRRRSLRRKEMTRGDSSGSSSFGRLRSCAGTAAGRQAYWRRGLMSRTGSTPASCARKRSATSRLSGKQVTVSNGVRKTVRKAADSVLRPRRASAPPVHTRKSLSQHRATLSARPTTFHQGSH